MIHYTRTDMIVQDKKGNFFIYEFKLSDKTKLSKGQQAVADHVKNSGGMVELRTNIKKWGLKRGDQIFITDYLIQ